MKTERNNIIGKIFNIALMGIAVLLTMQTWTRKVDHGFLWFHWTTNRSYSMAPTFRSTALALIFVIPWTIRRIVIPFRTIYETVICGFDVLFLATLLSPFSGAYLGSIPLWGILIAAVLFSMIGGKYVAGICWAITIGISIFKLAELNFVEGIGVVYLLCGCLGAVRQIGDMWGLSGYIENTKAVAKR